MAKNENENLEQFYELTKYLHSLDSSLDAGSSIHEFDAVVSYQSPKACVASVRTTVLVRFIGYSEPGTIEIYATPELSAEKFHLGLVPKWGKYSFNKASGRFSYKNHSVKMGGDFEIEIVPIPR